MNSSADRTESTRAAFPHSEIPGSKVVRTSPGLIAVDHVLLRLSAPKHPPRTLTSLTTENGSGACSPRFRLETLASLETSPELATLAGGALLALVIRLGFLLLEPPSRCQRPFRARGARADGVRRGSRQGGPSDVAVVKGKGETVPDAGEASVRRRRVAPDAEVYGYP
jgi:hypothetical protein